MAEVFDPVDGLVALVINRGEVRDARATVSARVSALELSTSGLECCLGPARVLFQGGETVVHVAEDPDGHLCLLTALFLGALVCGNNVG